MAQITVVYKDFAEMLAVARELLKGEEKTDLVTEETKQENVPYGRQIAPSFPDANVGMTQVQSAPVSEPIMNAPVASDPVTPTATAQATVPTSQHEYTMDELARAAMTVMDKGGMTQLQQLLAGYNCETLQQLPQEQYGSFATALRGMGAQI